MTAAALPTSPMHCTPVSLDADLMLNASRRAIEMNPANAPFVQAEPGRTMLAQEERLSPDRLAVLTSKYWGAGGVSLSVSFMEPCPSDLRDRILAHANAWGESANVRFAWTQEIGSAQVRITREGGGYWSYLGTDVLSIPQGRATMSLQGFTMSTPDSEYLRVVRHEFGHTLGFPHEHLRREIVGRIDPKKALMWGARVLRWDSATVRSQILTALEDISIMGSVGADGQSIMAYSLPGEIMRDGQAIPGGADIDPIDRAVVAKLYPGGVGPGDPDDGGALLMIPRELPAGRYTVRPARAPAQEQTEDLDAGELAGLKPEEATSAEWREFFNTVLEIVKKLRR